MNSRSCRSFVLAGLALLSASCCLPRPLATEASVANLMPLSVFPANGNGAAAIREFRVPSTGYAWLTISNPIDAEYQVNLNGARLRVRSNEPKRISVREGLNRLAVLVHGSDDEYIAIRIVAEADAVDVIPVLDASLSESAPINAMVHVTALGKDVPNAEVIVHLLEAQREPGFLPGAITISEPLLTGEVSNSQLPFPADNIISRRIATTDGDGRAMVALSGLSLGEARLQVGIGNGELFELTNVFVPQVSLVAPTESLTLPVDSARFLPLQLSVLGPSESGHEILMTYSVSPNLPGGISVNAPSRIRLDRSKRFPYNAVISADSVGDYTLQIAASDQVSGQSANIEVPVVVTGGDEQDFALYTPIAEPSGLRLGEAATRVRFVAQVAGPIKPESLTLDEVDASGKLLRAGIARLLDNGQGLDDRSGDNVYGGAASLDGSIGGERYFRVSVTSRSGAAIVSESRPFLVTRFPLTYPPNDPDALIESVSGRRSRFFSRQVLLVLGPEVAANDDDVESLARMVDGSIVGVSPAIRQYLVQLDADGTEEAVLEAIEQFLRQDGVVSAQRNYEVRPAAAPSEASTPIIAGCSGETSDCQWYIEHVNVAAAWEHASGIAAAEPIGVFEPFGVAATMHPDLTGKCQDGNGVMPCTSGTHGTQVAGVLAANGNNGGIAGVAWESEFHVFKDSGSSATFNASLASATQKVLNVSQDVGSSADLATIDAALGTGKLLVAAAGNVGKTGGICNSDVVKYPARHNMSATVAQRILAVGASDSADELADWGSCSNSGSWVDLYAPGRGIYTTNPTGFTHVDGTSLATPIVAGAADLLWSLNTLWSSIEVHDKILGRSKALATTTLNGELLIDAYAMLGVPAISLSGASPTIHTDCSNATAFTVAGANDPDLLDPVILWDSTDHISYAFVDLTGNTSLDSGPFEINPLTGEVSARAAACPLDPAAGPHNLRVRVTDSIGMSDEIDLTVNLQVSNFSGSFDFETPAMGAGEGRRGIDPYTPVPGVVFGIEDNYGFPDAVVGLVRNNATSACFEPSSVNQTLGTGRDASGTDDYIGLSAFPIRAEFSPQLIPNPGEQVRIGVQFQALTGTTVRVRLFDAMDMQVGVAQLVLTGLEGTCGFPGGQRTHGSITVTSAQPVSYAVFDVPINNPSGGRVFTIDDVSITVTP